MAEQPRGKYLRIVKHQHVAGLKHVGDARERRVFHPFVTSPQDEQTRRVPYRRRFLRNQLIGQSEVEVGDVHYLVNFILPGMV